MRSCKFNMVEIVEVAKAKALLEATKFVRRMCWDQVVVETDAH